MNFIIIVQARLNSKRLPGKVLANIRGVPLLTYLIERLNLEFDKSNIVIATSNKKHDDPLHNYCLENKLKCFRGSLNNVAKRMLDASKMVEANYFVRINGDSPLIDPSIIKLAINIYNNGKYDLVTNVMPRSFPIGQSVEVLKTSVFEKTLGLMFKDSHYEHVTKYYYEHPKQFRIKNFFNNVDLSRIKLVVDTQEDLKRLDKVVGRMEKPHFKYLLNDLIQIYSQ